MNDKKKFLPPPGEEFFFCLPWKGNIKKPPRIFYDVGRAFSQNQISFFFFEKILGQQFFLSFCGKDTNIFWIHQTIIRKSVKNSDYLRFHHVIDKILHFVDKIPVFFALS